MTPTDPTPLSAEDYWRGRCLDCAHPEHEMTCHELIPNGDPSNGPAYCPCAVQIDWMEQEIIRLRATLDARELDVEWLATALHAAFVGCNLTAHRDCTISVHFMQAERIAAEYGVLAALSETSHD